MEPYLKLYFQHISSIVDTDLGHLVVSVKTINVLMKVKRNIDQLKEICNELDIREIQAFTFETYNKKFNIHTRNICPRNGIEDPGCGIGNAALGEYLVVKRTRTYYLAYLMQF